MTVDEKLHGLLTSCGLCPDEARAVIERVREDPDQEDGLAKILNKQEDGYPDILMTASWMVVRTYAREWLTENKPEHLALHVLKG